MRVPLYIRAWWRLNAITEPPKIDTTVDGNVSAPLLSGGFQGPVGTGGSVTVNVLTPIPPPAEAPPESATVGQRIDFMTRALMHIQAAYVEERKERLIRQGENNDRYEEARKSRETMWRWIVGVAVGVGVCLVLVLITLWQFQTRFGFL